MKKAILFYVLIGTQIFTNAMAQGRDQASEVLYSFNDIQYQRMPENEARIIFYEKPEQHWKGVKTAGIALTASGTACIVVGLSNLTRTIDGKSSGDAVKKTVGIIIPLGGGGVAAASGAIMWSVAGHRLKKLRNNVSVEVSPASAAIIYRF